MAQAVPTEAVISLRATTYRISATQPKELPRIVAQIAGSLWSCRDLLSAPSESLKSGNEAANTVHRFKTSINSLLQDRSQEGRWAAVVLAKAAIEAGGVEVLSKSNSWVKSLLAILKKPAPPTTKQLTVITLTRIFMLTWDHSNLVREITTPALPAFILACLNSVEKDGFATSGLQTVLEAFATLIPSHPTLFRTYESQIRALIFRILAPPDGVLIGATQSHRNAAQRLLVLLHHCAPKQQGSHKWDETLLTTVAVGHRACDGLFRSTVERWKSSASVLDVVNTTTLSGLESGGTLEEPSGWQSIYADSERIITLLGILKSHLETPTTTAVPIRIGIVIDLLTRIFSVNAQSMQPKPDIPKDEREALFSTLPDVHVAAFELANVLLKRLGKASMPLLQSLSEFIVDIFRSESCHVSLRTATYRTLKGILDIAGPSMSRDDVAELAPLIQGCCNDLIPAGSKGTDSSIAKASNRSAKTDITSKSQTTHFNNPLLRPDVTTEATALLPVLFAQTYPAFISPKIRVQMERTASLTRNKQALVASVLNPARKDGKGNLQTSLLPLLAREYPHCPEVEALLRPRMPLVSARPSNIGEDSSNGYEEMGDDATNGALESQLMDEGPLDGGDEPPPTEPLHAMNQNEGFTSTQQDDEDLYSATPPSASPRLLDRPASNVSAETEISQNGQVGTKRAAADPASTELSAKRLRASPVAEALAEASSTGLPGPDPASVEGQIPVTAVVDQAEAGEVSGSTVTLPRAEAAASTAMASRPASLDIGSDDSDFELPPLTMEPDTDPEEEEDEEDDDEV